MRKILRFQTKGYRSLYDVTWQPGDLNVLIGPNGSGKSNLLRLLEMVSVSAKGQLGRHIQRLGGIGPLLWDGSAERIEFKVDISPEEPTRDVARDTLTYEADIARIGDGSSFRIDRELLGNYYRVKTGERTGPFKLLERSPWNSVVFDENEHSLAAPEGSIHEEETLLSLAAGPFTQNRFIPPIQTYLANWSVYHDLHVNLDAPIRQAVVTRHETRVAPDGQNLINVLHTLYTGNRRFKEDVDMAMRAAFGADFLGLVFAPAADQRIQLRVEWKSLKQAQSAADLSDGTLRFLFLVAVLATPTPAPLIAIDEPETGLHPSMLPIIAEYAVEASHKTQVVLTTHSPQFLDAFGDERPMTCVVKWSSGKTELANVDGVQLDRWLKEYSLGDLYRSGELENSLTELNDTPESTPQTGTTR